MHQTIGGEGNQTAAAVPCLMQPHEDQSIKAAFCCPRGCCSDVKLFGRFKIIQLSQHSSVDALHVEQNSAFHNTK